MIINAANDYEQGIIDYSAFQQKTFLCCLTEHLLDFSIHPNSFTNNTSKNTIWVKLLTNGLESRDMLYDRLALFRKSISE